MGCCSGRCTLAFICGMQLVSDEITIDPVTEMIDQERGKKAHILSLFLSSKRFTNKLSMGNQKHLKCSREVGDRCVCGLLRGYKFRS